MEPIPLSLCLSVFIATAEQCKYFGNCICHTKFCHLPGNTVAGFCHNSFQIRIHFTGDSCGCDHTAKIFIAHGNGTVYQISKNICQIRVETLNDQIPGNHAIILKRHLMQYKIAGSIYVFDLSVMDNIRMGKKGATDEEVIDAAKKCGCHEFIMGLENGYQTICGASGGHLSGGERQRISIARAMLKDAPIVILDEATSYTDPENEAVIQSALAKLVRGKTLLVIAHRLSTIADADQIIVVNHGKIEATGTQSELLASCPLYQTMWEAHISVKDDGEVA